jgi:hypothetical protein
MRTVLMPVEMPPDHDGVVGRSNGVMGEACEVPKLEVPRPNFITQGVSRRQDGAYKLSVGSDSMGRQSLGRCFLRQRVKTLFSKLQVVRLSMCSLYKKQLPINSVAKSSPKPSSRHRDAQNTILGIMLFAVFSMSFVSLPYDFSSHL